MVWGDQVYLSTAHRTAQYRLARQMLNYLMVALACVIAVLSLPYAVGSLAVRRGAKGAAWAIVRSIGVFLAVAVLAGLLLFGEKLLDIQHRTAAPWIMANLLTLLALWLWGVQVRPSSRLRLVSALVCMLSVGLAVWALPRRDLLFSGGPAYTGPVLAMSMLPLMVGLMLLMTYFIARRRSRGQAAPADPAASTGVMLRNLALAGAGVLLIALAGCAGLYLMRARLSVVDHLLGDTQLEPVAGWWAAIGFAVAGGVLARARRGVPEQGGHDRAGRCGAAAGRGAVRVHVPPPAGSGADAIHRVPGSPKRPGQVGL